MPSPLGHALGGVIAGWLVAGDPGSERGAAATAGGEPCTWRHRLRQAGLFAALGMAADLDLLAGLHSQFTHSIGAILMVLALAALVLRARHRGVALASSVAAAYASHPFLDWLAQDGTPPRGIMALWPFTAQYYLSYLDLFLGISREPWRPGAAWHNVVAVTREVLLLGPPALAAWWLRGGGRQFLRGRTVAPGQQLLRPKGLRREGESPTEP